MSKNETIVIFFTIGWLIPFVLILITNKVRGSEKLLWAVLTLAGSWFTFGFYTLVAPIHEPPVDKPTDADQSGENT